MSDLIDREVLKEDLRRFFPTEVLEGIEPKTLFAQIMHDIDNAPTALFPLTVKINDNVTDEDIETLKRLMEDYKPQVVNIERPQGEYTEEDIKCAIKESFELGYEMAKNKYECPNCGTSMKGDDNCDK